MISLEKSKISTPLQKLPKIVGDLGELISKALKSCTKCKKSPNLVTLFTCPTSLGKYNGTSEWLVNY